jgi:hypothetical protein
LIPPKELRDRNFQVSVIDESMISIRDSQITHLQEEVTEKQIKIEELEK